VRSATSTIPTVTVVVPSPSSTIVPIYGQCGGQNWTGPTQCAWGSVCKYQSQYYWQCRDPNETTQQPQPTTRTTIRTTIYPTTTWQPQPTVTTISRTTIRTTVRPTTTYQPQPTVTTISRTTIRTTIRPTTTQQPQPQPTRTTIRTTIRPTTTVQPTQNPRPTVTRTTIIENPGQGPIIVNPTVTRIEIP
jgi:hypothetical protein